MEVGFSLSVLYFVVLRFEPRTPHMPHTCSITKLLSQSWRVNFQSLSDGWPLKNIVIIWKEKWGRLSRNWMERMIQKAERAMVYWVLYLLSAESYRASHCRESGERGQVSILEADSVCTLCKVSHQALGGSAKVTHDYRLQVCIEVMRKYRKINKNICSCKENGECLLHIRNRIDDKQNQLHLLERQTSNWKNYSICDLRILAGGPT